MKLELLGLPVVAAIRVAALKTRPVDTFAIPYALVLHNEGEPDYPYATVLLVPGKKHWEVGSDTLGIASFKKALAIAVELAGWRSV